MRYLLLIHTDEAVPMSADDRATMHQQYGELTQWLTSTGILEGGEALQPTATARTVRVRDGRTVTTDGPFAETKEQLGGYYLVDAADLDQAIEAAARIPGAALGSVEVRPIMEFA